MILSLIPIFSEGKGKEFFKKKSIIMWNLFKNLLLVARYGQSGVNDINRRSICIIYFINIKNYKTKVADASALR
ncbi:MAG: hypothetical protein EBX50_05955 [Chitinophagia bacterium]|nr:hypothetical protein [Chitinophagia bacterium]